MARGSSARTCNDVLNNGCQRAIKADNFEGCHQHVLGGRRAAGAAINSAATDKLRGNGIQSSVTHDSNGTPLILRVSQRQEPQPLPATGLRGRIRAWRSERRQRGRNYINFDTDQ